MLADYASVTWRTRLKNSVSSHTACMRAHVNTVSEKKTFSYARKMSSPSKIIKYVLTYDINTLLHAPLTFLAFKSNTNVQIMDWKYRSKFDERRKLQMF